MKSRGFTLIETMIVVAALMVIATIGMMYFTQKTQSDARTSYIGSEANDLSLLAQGVTKYVSTPPSSWTAKGTAYQIQVSDLITAQDLPANFANRNGAVGTSPFYQIYQIWGELDPTDSNPRVAILDTGNISAAQLTRMGSANTATAVLAIKQTIANAVAQNQWAAGTIAVGANSVTGSGGAWTKDLSTWYTPAPTVAAAAVLIGYPNLSGSPSGGTNPQNKWGNCVFAQPKYNPGTGTDTPAQCPAGMQTVATVPNCGPQNTIVTPQYAVYTSDVGDIVFGSNPQISTVQLQTGWSGYTCGLSTCYNPVYDVFTNYKGYEDVYLNGAVIATDGVCSSSNYMQAACPKPPTAGSCVNHSTVSYAQEPAGLLGAQSVDLLCCAPKP